MTYMKNHCRDCESKDRELKRLASAAHNFYVTVMPWMHHMSDFLIAAEKDLRSALGKHINDVIYKAGGEDE